MTALTQSKTRALLAAATAIGLALPSIAIAQDASSDSEEKRLDTIVATGSNIRSDNFNSSSPLQVFEAEDIAKVGDRNIADFLQQIPSITGADTASSNQVNTSHNSGLNTIALRNLGPTRTLVLVNGRRYVSGTSAATGYGVDLNSIPTGIIERVDVLTGGQSAAYGSDAIAGVINIITRQDFEGVDLKGQYGQTGKNDRERIDFELTVGGKFSPDGDAWMSLGYSDAKGILSRDRDFSAVGFSAVDTTGDGLLDSPAFIGSSFIPTARLGGFQGDGSPFSRADNTIENSDAFNFHEFRQFLTPFERLFAAAGVNYQLSDKASLNLEANFSQVDSSGRFEPIPFSVTADVFLTNRGGVTGINIDPNLGPVHPLFDGTPLQASLLAAGATSLDNVGFVGRRLVEFGTRGEDNRRQTFRIAGSLDYEITQDLHLTLSGTYGRTTQNQVVPGDLNLERARFALDIEPDGNGGFQCVDPLARQRGCVPFNPFAAPNDPLGIGISAEAIDYLSIVAGNNGEVEQSVLTAVLSGDLNYDLFNAGKPGFAVGLEYRKESGSDTPDAFRQDGIARGLRLQPTSGNYDVVEAFAEIRLPVHEKLTLDGAVRTGNYSTVGRTTTFKFGADAPVNDYIRLRAAYSESVRAPNVADLFAGGNATAAFVFDPCNGVTAATTGNVADNCRSNAAILNRINTTGAFTLSQVETQNTLGVVGGSPDVQEEQAKSLTLGGVLTAPVGGGNLSLALDYYDIRIDDVIVNLDRTVILDRCYNVAPSQFDPTCGGTTFRSPVSGAALDVNSITSNESLLETRGVDVELRYSIDPESVPGVFDIGMTANYLLGYTVTDNTSGDVDVKDGEILFPNLRFNVDLGYEIDQFAFNWRLRYWGSTVDNKDNTAFTDEFNSFDAVIYNDVSVQYNLTDTTSVQFGIRNLFDNSPQLLTFNHQYHQLGTNSNGTAWDLEGRRWFAGVRSRF